MAAAQIGLALAAPPSHRPSARLMTGAAWGPLAGLDAQALIDAPCGEFARLVRGKHDPLWGLERDQPELAADLAEELAPEFETELRHAGAADGGPGQILAALADQRTEDGERVLDRVFDALPADPYAQRQPPAVAAFRDRFAALPPTYLPETIDDEDDL